ncbi:N-carbamoyl-L-amino-acid hydrolase [Geodia barretti]|uniref:N-carbamoyl-L-amino-acid hydrolase n=1 Tax=Geodia barretti TaxID=519541 RepID=A0AA35W1I8_GEOBA|nr:N-carbamoyl-L-amino-acid hydrolase [Geodia barretti]
MEMAKIGATEKGGVCRLALTDVDKAARDLFVQWCGEAGCAVQRRQDGQHLRPPGWHGRDAPAGDDRQPHRQPADGWQVRRHLRRARGPRVIRTLNDLGYRDRRTHRGLGLDQ